VAHCTGGAGARPAHGIHGSGCRGRVAWPQGRVGSL